MIPSSDNSCMFPFFVNLCCPGSILGARRQPPKDLCPHLYSPPSSVVTRPPASVSTTTPAQVSQGLSSYSQYASTMPVCGSRGPRQGLREAPGRGSGKGHERRDARAAPGAFHPQFMCPGRRAGRLRPCRTTSATQSSQFVDQIDGCFPPQPPASLTAGNVDQVDGRRPQPPHTPRPVRQYLEELHVLPPGCPVVITKARHLRVCNGGGGIRVPGDQSTLTRDQSTLTRGSEHTNKGIRAH